MSNVDTARSAYETPSVAAIWPPCRSMFAEDARLGHLGRAAAWEGRSGVVTRSWPTSRRSPTTGPRSASSRRSSSTPATTSWFAASSAPANDKGSFEAPFVHLLKYEDGKSRARRILHRQRQGGEAPGLTPLQALAVTVHREGAREAGDRELLDDHGALLGERAAAGAGLARPRRRGSQPSRRRSRSRLGKVIRSAGDVEVADAADPPAGRARRSRSEPPIARRRPRSARSARSTAGAGLASSMLRSPRRRRIRSRSPRPRSGEAPASRRAEQGPRGQRRVVAQRRRGRRGRGSPARASRQPARLQLGRGQPAGEQRHRRRQRGREVDPDGREVADRRRAPPSRRSASRPRSRPRRHRRPRPQPRRPPRRPTAGRRSRAAA